MGEKGLQRVVKLYEKKLRELMPEDEYRQFVESVAKMVFAAEIMESPNEDLKELVFENWDAITAPVVSETGGDAE